MARAATLVNSARAAVQHIRVLLHDGPHVGAGDPTVVLPDLGGACARRMGSTRPPPPGHCGPSPFQASPSGRLRAIVARLPGPISATKTNQKTVHELQTLARRAFADPSPAALRAGPDRPPPADAAPGPCAAAPPEAAGRPPQYAVCGLHCCGGLTSSTLSAFLHDPDAAVLCVVGCCYNLLVPDDRVEAGAEASGGSTAPDALDAPVAPPPPPTLTDRDALSSGHVSAAPTPSSAPCAAPVAAVVAREQTCGPPADVAPATSVGPLVTAVAPGPSPAGPGAPVTGSDLLFGAGAPPCDHFPMSAALRCDRPPASLTRNTLMLACQSLHGPVPKHLTAESLQAVAFRAVMQVCMALGHKAVLFCLHNSDATGGQAPFA